MFDELTKKVNSLATKLNDITNRELLYEIYPYVWDIRGVISLLNSYIKWLGEFDSTLLNCLHFIGRESGIFVNRLMIRFRSLKVSLTEDLCIFLFRSIGTFSSKCVVLYMWIIYLYVGQFYFENF